MSTLHAHVESESADCDGRYSRTYTMDAVLAYAEDSYDFGNHVLVAIVSTGTEMGTLSVTQTGDGHPHFEWNERTEEGFRAIVAWLCTADDCDQSHTQRDHSAEAAGY